MLYPTTDFAEITAEAALYEFNEQQILRGGSWWVAVRNDSVWIIINNGGDGNDWSQNNMLTWGAGAIARLLPESYRPQVLELLAAAGASPKQR